MIISWNPKIKRPLFVGAALIILLAVAYLAPERQLPVDTPIAVTEEEQLNKSINQLLSEKEKDNFFAEYRIERDRIRSEQMETLRDILSRDDISQDAKDSAAIRLVKITEDVEREMKAENLVKSQNYDDCVVIIQAEAATVVVLAPVLRLDQEEEVKDLVARSLQCNEDSLCIITRSR